jgi:hypothetical protein
MGHGMLWPGSWTGDRKGPLGSHMLEARVTSVAVPMLTSKPVVRTPQDILTYLLTYMAWV